MNLVTSEIYTHIILYYIKKKPQTNYQMQLFWFYLPALHVFLHLLFFLSSHFFSWRSLGAKNQTILFVFSVQPVFTYITISFIIRNITNSIEMQFFIEISEFHDALLFILMPSSSFCDLNHHTKREKGNIFFHKVRVTILLGSTIPRMSYLANLAKIKRGSSILFTTSRHILSCQVLISVSVVM